MTPRMNGATAGPLAGAVMALAVAASAMPDCRTTVASLKAQNGGALPAAIAGAEGVDAANLSGILECVCKVQPDHAQCRPEKAVERPKRPSCGEALREYEARRSGVEALVKNEDPTLYPPGGWIRPWETQVDWFRSRRDTGVFTESAACAQLSDLRAHESLIWHIISECGGPQDRRQARRSALLLPTEEKYHDWLRLRSDLMYKSALGRLAKANLKRVLANDGLSCPGED